MDLGSGKNIRPLSPEDASARRHRKMVNEPGGGHGVDYFDGLPDSLLLTIFNRLGDIKALGRCCAVSKRFYGLASQVDSVVVKVDCVISGEDATLNVKGAKGHLSNLVRLVYGSILKPFQALQQLLAPKRASGGGGKPAAEVSHHSPGEVLRNFKEIQKLRIELPGGELGIEDDIVLKWKAEFGSTVESCVILGAYRKQDGRKPAPLEPASQAPAASSKAGSDPAPEEELPQASQEDNGSIPESFYTDGSLKSRVVWTISSLIAASARHYLLQQIISEHPSLESLVLTDADGQGTLCMDKRQLEEFRDKPIAASTSSNRTQVPALNMKLWYAPSLRLADGSLLSGATLVAIRPSDRAPPHKEMQGFIGEAFEEPFKSAAALLVQRRTYLLEMNSF